MSLRKAIAHGKEHRKEYRGTQRAQCPSYPSRTLSRTFQARASI